ncbi:T3SS (YopN, CesT) and YbjN peptide-binding chaperone 1 [Capilliphycus salinus ALCB114379]|uniref:T3SS (YopN, CesT) and YbjN peptide-binding chaperone 1 n=1 Tax=Capilliphycus salinus TaxID=2768948 RepID=UPI0039A70A7A
MMFKTEAQENCYHKILGWMDELFENYPWEKLDEPGFGLFLGSAWVEVLISPWEEDETVIKTLSKVVIDAKITPELTSFLLQENSEMMFGAFSINRSGEILFGHSIVGSTCDPEELEASVLTVLEVSDDYDDKIIQTWGGKRALDIAPC